DAADAGRAMQVEAVLALGVLPVAADVVDLGAGDGPALDFGRVLIERLELAGVGPHFEAAVDDETLGFLLVARGADGEPGRGQRGDNDDEANVAHGATPGWKTWR